MIKSKEYTTWMHFQCNQVAYQSYWSTNVVFLCSWTELCYTVTATPFKSFFTEVTFLSMSNNQCTCSVLWIHSSPFRARVRWRKWSLTPWRLWLIKFVCIFVTRFLFLFLIGVHCLSGNSSDSSNRRHFHVINCSMGLVTIFIFETKPPLDVTFFQATWCCRWLFSNPWPGYGCNVPYFRSVSYYVHIVFAYRHLTLDELPQTEDTNNHQVSSNKKCSSQSSLCPLFVAFTCDEQYNHSVFCWRKKGWEYNW